MIICYIQIFNSLCSETKQKKLEKLKVIKTSETSLVKWYSFKEENTSENYQKFSFFLSFFSKDTLPGWGGCSL